MELGGWLSCLPQGMPSMACFPPPGATPTILKSNEKIKMKKSSFFLADKKLI